MTIEASTKQLEKGLKELERQFRTEDILDEMEVIGQELIKRSINAPIPSDTRLLANSGDTVIDRNRKSVTFGFNQVYAAFQDAPGRTKPYIIRPKRKKWIYVPVSQAGRRHRLGANPRNEGLVFGGFIDRTKGRGVNRGGDADYILAKEVVVPVKRYGSEVGPNHYFSGTLSRNVDFALEALAARLTRRLQRRFRGR